MGKYDGQETVYLDVTVSKENAKRVIAELQDMEDIYFVAESDQ